MYLEILMITRFIEIFCVGTEPKRRGVCEVEYRYKTGVFMILIDYVCYSAQCACTITSYEYRITDKT